ncbi:hypothetical protein ACFQPA_11995 [Halomarina halobia]|uniref:DUF7988 domain-containing protein n=1 Tax=Halomarina halobia TaxID=3033386 RepID=A0ABD6AAJ6_9EURY|nr:hypothetical protein [Halomarina sp. PSR21]
MREAVRTYLLTEHRRLVERVLDCADAVAESEDLDTVDSLSNPLSAALAHAGITQQFPGVLAGAVEAAGEELPADPVAAPPYVVVTSAGPILRATLDSGRLVVRIEVFRLEHGPRRYVRTARTPEAAVSVEVR